MNPKSMMTVLEQILRNFRKFKSWNRSYNLLNPQMSRVQKSPIITTQQPFDEDYLDMVIGL